MALADASHILVTTFADGGRQASAERIVALPDAEVGFWTPDITAWQPRLAASPVVTVQACNSRGAVDREQPLLEGRARVVLDGPLLQAAREATHAKYGLAVRASGWVDRLKELGGEVTPEGAVVIDVVG